MTHPCAGLVPQPTSGWFKSGSSAGNSSARPLRREKMSDNQTSYHTLSFPLSELQYFIDELGSFAPKDPLFSSVCSVWCCGES